MVTLKRHMLKIFGYSIPFLVFIGLVLLFWKGLVLDPRALPSTLIGEPAPPFNVPILNKPHVRLTNQDLLGHVSLLNIWASWCLSCKEEHAFLMELAQNKQIVLFGLNYKDNPEEAKHWLKHLGNPYQKVADDPLGKMAIDWGVYGTPETFIIDKQGIVRYKHIGPLTAAVWEQRLLPVINKLNEL